MIHITLWNLMWLVPPLILLEGFFSGSEIALLSADKLALQRMAKMNSKGAEKALSLLLVPERLLSTTILMTSLCVIAVSALIGLYFLERIPEHSEIAAILVTSPLVVLAGELIPKTLYQRYAVKLAPWVAYPVSWTYWAFYPFTRLLSLYSTRLSRIAGPIEELLTGKGRNTREDLQSLLSYSKRETEIKSSERSMIKRIFDFQDADARSALIPLVRVEAIEDSATVQEALERFQRNRHSRMPVFSERIDNIVGVIETHSLFAATDVHQPIRGMVTAAHYVAETQSLEDVMLEMHREDNEMVVVVDEHGGAVGCLTFEDIVEEIVGDIQDEYDSETALFTPVSDHAWLVQARIEIQQINERLVLDLPEGDYKTLSGFLLQQFGRIPDSRDELFFNTSQGSLKFTIRKATARHIETVLIEKMGDTPKT